MGESGLDSLAQAGENCEFQATLKWGFGSHEMSEIS